LQSNAVQPAAQPIASQATKDSLSASASGSSQAGPLLHAESDDGGSIRGHRAGRGSTDLGSVAGIAAAQAATVPLPQPSVPLEQAPPPRKLGPGSSAALPTAALGPVQMAQMVDRVGHPEMRVGMNTSAFGNVEVRTVVHASDVGLTIGSEKGDLRAMLANDMPAIANNLQQQNLRLSSVSYSQDFILEPKLRRGRRAAAFFCSGSGGCKLWVAGSTGGGCAGSCAPRGIWGAGNSLSILA